MRTEFALIIFLLYSFNLFGQSDSGKQQRLREYAYFLDSSLNKYDSSFLNLENASINLKNYGNKVTADIQVGESFLSASLYVKEANLVFVKFKEPSPTMPDLSAFTEFYFEGDTVFYYHPYFSIRSCMALPILTKSMIEIFGYNPDFTKEYLLTLIHVLYCKINPKLTRSLTQ